MIDPATYVNASIKTCLIKFGGRWRLKDRRFCFGRQIGGADRHGGCRKGDAQ